MDFITGLSTCYHGERKYDAILVVVDRYTKMARYIPTQKTIDSAGLAEVIYENVIRLFGVPEGIVTDRGTVFTSAYWSHLCSHLKIHRKLSTAFHPQTDGQTERQNQTIEAYLRSYCNDKKDDWVSILGLSEFVYNNSKHSSTGLPPFCALYSYNPTLPHHVKGRVMNKEVPAARERVNNIVEAWKDMEKRWERATKSQAKHYDKAHMPIQFNIYD